MLGIPIRKTRTVKHKAPLFSYGDRRPCPIAWCGGEEEYRPHAEGKWGEYDGWVCTRFERWQAEDGRSETNPH